MLQQSLYPLFVRRVCDVFKGPFAILRVDYKKHVLVQIPWNRNLFVTSQLFFVCVTQLFLSILTSWHVGGRGHWYQRHEAIPGLVSAPFSPLLWIYSHFIFHVDSLSRRYLTFVQTRWAVITITVQNCHDLPSFLYKEFTCEEWASPVWQGPVKQWILFQVFM